MKLLGLCLLAAGAIWAALEPLIALRRQDEATGEMLRALTVLEGALCGELMPMGDALRLAGRLGAGSAFIRLAESLEELGELPFSRLWCRELGGLMRSLTPAGREAAAVLGESLGRTDALRQQRAISSCLDVLRLERDRLRSEGRKSAGLRAAMSLGAGAVLMIMLM